MEPCKPEKKQWISAKVHIQVEKDIPFFEKLLIKRQGKIDARRGVIDFSENDAIIHSDFCNEMVEDADRKLELVWRRCDADLNEYRPYLDYWHDIFIKLNEKYNEIEDEKKTIIKKIKSTQLPGDSEMSKATVDARIKKRILEATHDINLQLTQLEDQMNNIAIKTKISVNDYEAREIIAESDENMITHATNTIMWLYMQGTWRLIDSRPFDIKLPKLTEAPKNRHYRHYPKYSFVIKKKLTMDNQNRGNNESY